MLDTSATTMSAPPELARQVNAGCIEHAEERGTSSLNLIALSHRQAVLISYGRYGTVFGSPGVGNFVAAASVRGAITGPPEARFSSSLG